MGEPGTAIAKFGPFAVEFKAGQCGGGEFFAKSPKCFGLRVLAGKPSGEIFQTRAALA